MSAKQYSYPLHQAISNGDLKRLKRLIRVKSIDINKTDKLSEKHEDANPLYLAIKYPFGEKLRVQMVKVLLSRSDLKVNLYHYDLEGQTTDLSFDQIKQKGLCLLHMWIEEGNLELVKALVQHPKIDIEDVTKGIYVAIKSKHLSKPSNKKLQNDMIKVLLSHPEAFVNMKLFQNIPESRGDFKKKGFSLLEMWIEEGKLELIKGLIKHPEMKIDEISKGIINAIRSLNLCEPSNEKLQNDIINTLLEHPNINVNIQSKGFPALHFAIAREQVKTVETLLRHPKIHVNQLGKISSDEQNQYGRKLTPLILSMQHTKTTDITRLLLEHSKIDVNLTDEGICLPINSGVDNQINFECFKMLLNHTKIDVNAKDKFTCDATPLIFNAATRESNINDKEYPNAKYYHEEAFKLLLNHEKVDLKLQDQDGRNILHHVILSIMDTEDLDIISHKKNVGAWYTLLSEMLETHPHLITPDKDGLTPINLANEFHDTFGLMKDALERYIPKNAIQPPVKVVGVRKESRTEDDDVPKPNLTKCCWNCNSADVKLYKCTGCKKAYYCSRTCIEHDWPVHGGYCQRKQLRKRKFS